MKEVQALPVCSDCNCIMFRKLYKGDSEVLKGWSCPECHVTKWDEVK